MSEERERRGETSDKKKKARDFLISLNYSSNKLLTPKSMSKIRKEEMDEGNISPIIKESYSPTVSSIIGPFEKSILKEHFGFPNISIPVVAQTVAAAQNLPFGSSQTQIYPSSLFPLSTFGKVPEYNKGMNYYQEFWKLFFTNEVIIKRLQDYKKEILVFRDQADRLEEMVINNEDGMSQDQDSKSQTNTVQKVKKKNRRCAQDIQKDYNCPYENCSKTYGSEVSLNLHIKIKHNGGNKTEREKLARQIFAAKSNGEQIPEMNLNLPPGFIDDISSGGPKSDYLKPKHNANLDKDKISNQPASANHK